MKVEPIADEIVGLIEARHELLPADLVALAIGTDDGARVRELGSHDSPSKHIFQTLTGCSGWYAPDVPRILVVDDEPDVADLVAAILRPAGFEVATVHGGRAALEQLAAAPYDLVICDLVMPDVDGLAVYRAIQTRGEPRPLMLFLSGYHDAGGYEALLREARVPTAAKPFDVDELRRTVKRLLGDA